MRILSLEKTQWVERRSVGCVKIRGEGRGRGIGVSMGMGKGKGSIYFGESCHISISNFKENMTHVFSNLIMSHFLNFI